MKKLIEIVTVVVVLAAWPATNCPGQAGSTPAPASPPQTALTGTNNRNAIVPRGTAITPRAPAIAPRGTAITPQGSGTAIVPQGSQTAIVPQRTGTIIMPQGSSTAIGQQGSGTAIGQQGSGTAIGQQGSGTAIGQPQTIIGSGSGGTNRTPMTALGTNRLPARTNRFTPGR